MKEASYLTRRWKGWCEMVKTELGDSPKVDVVTLSVKFYKPYADELAAKGTVAVARVAEWVKGFEGVGVERVSMYELKLLNVPWEKILKIKGAIKQKIVTELGWQDEPSNVVSFTIDA